MQAIRNKQLPEQPFLASWEHNTLWDISKACWHHTPKKRMTVEMLITTLAKARKRLLDIDQMAYHLYAKLVLVVFDARHANTEAREDGKTDNWVSSG